ncbi:hypothetical protein HK101_006414 [Irineochytrium annulatum]|nr:hypothetical protein HK101_006414 [Irineochytrium annulatum]
MTLSRSTGSVGITSARGVTPPSSVPTSKPRPSSSDAPNMLRRSPMSEADSMAEPRGVPEPSGVPRGVDAAMAAADRGGELPVPKEKSRTRLGVALRTGRAGFVSTGGTGGATTATGLGDVGGSGGRPTVGEEDAGWLFDRANILTPAPAMATGAMGGGERAPDADEVRSTSGLEERGSFGLDERRKSARESSGSRRFGVVGVVGVAGGMSPSAVVGMTGSVADLDDVVLGGGCTAELGFNTPLGFSICGGMTVETVTSVVVRNETSEPTDPRRFILGRYFLKFEAMGKSSSVRRRAGVEESLMGSMSVPDRRRFSNSRALEVSRT